MSIFEYWLMVFIIYVVGITCVSKDRPKGVLFTIGIMLIMSNTVGSLFLAILVSYNTEYNHTKYNGVLVIKDTHIILEHLNAKPFTTNDMYILNNKDNLCHIQKLETNYFNYTRYTYTVEVCPSKGIN